MSERMDTIVRLADEVIVACALNTPKPRGARGTIIGACGDAWDAGAASRDVEIAAATERERRLREALEQAERDIRALNTGAVQITGKGAWGAAIACCARIVKDARAALAAPSTSTGDES